MTKYSVGERVRKGLTLRNEMSIKLPALSVNEGMARAAVAAFCAQTDPSATELADIKCAVSEAVTNSIVHAYGDGVGEVRIRVRLFDGGIIHIEIRDRGCGIADVRQARQPLYTTDRDGERSGMGFTVMESFCDGVRVASALGRGTSVTLIKRIGGRGLRKEDM